MQLWGWGEGADGGLGWRAGGLYTLPGLARAGQGHDRPMTPGWHTTVPLKATWEQSRLPTLGPKKVLGTMNVLLSCRGLCGCSQLEPRGQCDHCIDTGALCAGVGAGAGPENLV